MTQSKHGVSDQKASLEPAVRNAEERAQRAEKKVEELEKAVAELKSGSTVPAGEDAEVERSAAEQNPEGDDSVAALRADSMMAHLIDSLDSGRDIGHYGRLVFAMVAHHFLSQQQLLEWLTKDPDFTAEEARALIRQVESRDYNPPRRERILAWQAQQEYPILPNVDDPDCGNVYRNLKFPDRVYEHIQEYQEEKSEGDAHAA